MLRIKEMRESKGISMKEAARLLNLPYTTYVNYEKGLREPTSELLIQIADFFGVSIDFLLGRCADNTAMSSVVQFDETQSKGQVTPAHNLNRNIIRIAARNGTCQERTLSDDQLAALKAILDQMPDASGDL